jgi:glyoxylase-like metal-dependent hydrolase (beta-lactamase superfamily II)
VGPSGDWTEPGAFEVAAGVFRIPLPLPSDALRAVNVYLVEATTDLVLIDGGWALARSRDQLDRSLRALGRGVGDLTRILVTHSHRDHYTQAVTLGRELQVPVGLGADERLNLEAVLAATSTSLSAQRTLLRQHGAAALADGAAVEQLDGPIDDDVWALPDEWIEDGARLELAGRQLVATATPGHTRGHMVFSDETAGLLFAGDHVLPHITPSLGFEPVPLASPLGSYLQSLAAMRAAPDRMLLPAHGPVGTSVHARVDELLAHHDGRLTGCVRAVAGGATTAYEVAGRLPWTRREHHLDDLDPFNAVLAVAETVSHLLVLEAQARVRSSVVDGTVVWSEGRE